MGQTLSDEAKRPQSSQERGIQPTEGIYRKQRLTLRPHSASARRADGPRLGLRRQMLDDSFWSLPEQVAPGGFA